MNTETAEPVAEPVEPATPAPEPLPDLPLSEHEEDFPTLTRAERRAETRASRAAAPPAAQLGTDGAPLSDASAEDAAGRDDKGRFRHRAKSQQAGAGDVPRINELTAKLRAAEAERDALKARPSTPPPVQHQPQTPAVPVPRLPQTVADKAPQLKDFVNALTASEVYEDALQKHAEALADWRWQRGEQQAAQKQAEQRFYADFQAKVKDASEKYPDFQAVAMDPDSVIPPGSLIDSWVWEHPAGAHVLYHMQKNPADVARIHALPSRLEQLSELSLLSQRLTAPSSRSAAAGTGSAPAPVVTTPAPRPPNPVRTGPMKAADEPPGDDASLSAHEKHWNQPRRRP